jgi:general secretion pathway protein G
MTARRQDAFTLLEIMVVVLIIGMLMAVIAPRIFGRFGQAKRDIARVQVTQIASSLELYKLDNGHYPTNEQGLDALVHEPTSEPRARQYPAGGYIASKALVDPWQTPFHYERPGKNNPQSYDLYSFGDDGAAGGEGDNADIGNWEIQEHP